MAANTRAIFYHLRIILLCFADALTGTALWLRLKRLSAKNLYDEYHKFWYCCCESLTKYMCKYFCKYIHILFLFVFLRKIEAGRSSPSKSPSKSPNKSPSKSPNKPSPSSSRRSSDQQPPAPKTRIDPKLGTQRKTAGVRNLPKIDGGKKSKTTARKNGAKLNGTAKQNGGIHEEDEEEEANAHAQENGGGGGTGSSAGSSRRSEPSTVDELEPVEEEEKD